MNPPAPAPPTVVGPVGAEAPPPPATGGMEVGAVGAAAGAVGVVSSGLAVLVAADIVDNY